jgi:FkbM family methyltransferase
VHWEGLPLLPKRCLKRAPFNREAFNGFIVEAAEWRLGPAPVIYDVGANNGDFALAFQRVYPAARITLFEPLTRHVKRLESLRDGGGFPWAIQPVALGAGDETLEIEVPEGQEAASSLHGFGGDYLRHNPGAEKTSRQLCQVRRLDGLERAGGAMGRIDLLKIDVEGFEFSMLEGAVETLARVRNVVVEVSRLRHGGTAGCPIARMVAGMAAAGLSLFRMEPTIVNREIDPHPLEYDLYFTRMGKESA